MVDAHTSEWPNSDVTILFVAHSRSLTDVVREILDRIRADGVREEIGTRPYSTIFALVSSEKRSVLDRFRAKMYFLYGRTESGMQKMRSRRNFLTPHMVDVWRVAPLVRGTF